MFQEKQTRWEEEEWGREYQGMDKTGNWQVPEGIEEQRKLKTKICQVMCGASLIDTHREEFDDDNNDGSGHQYQVLSRTPLL